MKAYTVRTSWLLPALLVVAGAAAYASSFLGAFVIDDAKVIAGNPRIRQARPPADWFRPRFLVDATFAVNYAVGGLNPADYHAVNLAAHVASALALFALLRRTIGLPGVPRWLAERGESVAFLAAAAWETHPLATSAVTYVCQRYEVVMALFYLLTLYALGRGATAGAARRGAWYALSVAACAMGMASKEVMITAPVVALAYDRIFVAGSFRRLWRERGAVYGGYALCWALLAMLTAAGTPDVAPRGGAGAAAAGAARYALTQAGVITRYLRLSLWPQGLCLDYAWPAATGVAEALPGVVLVAGLLAVSGIGLLVFPRAAFAGFFFFAVLSATSGFLPRPDNAFEHRMYLPLTAVTVTAAVGLAWALRLVSARLGLSRRWEAGLYWSLAVALVAVLGCATRERNLVFQSEERMWRDVVSRRPGNLRALAALNAVLLRQGRFGEAADGARLLLERSRAALKDGSGRAAVAASHPVLYYPMANNQAGLALLGQGRAEDSLPWFSEAVRAGRSQREAFLYDRALALVALGRRGEAERDLAAALRLRPGMDKARVMLGVALAERGEYGGAVRHLEMAARSDPSLVMARVELAWVLAACPDDRVRDGRRALKLGLAARAATGGRSRRALEVLAACYAENGMFEEAVRTARLALSCPGGGEGAETTSEGSSAASSAAGAAEHSARVEAALRLYESGQPLRLVPVPQGGGAGRGAAPGPGASRGP